MPTSLAADLATPRFPEGDFGLSPEPLEPMSGNAGVMGCVLGISVPQVSQIRALVDKAKLGRVWPHMLRHSCGYYLAAGQAHDVVDGLAGQLGLALGQEQPGQIILPKGKVALDGTQLVACDG